jgi:hypothetical protein
MLITTNISHRNFKGPYVLPHILWALPFTFSDQVLCSFFTCHARYAGGSQPIWDTSIGDLEENAHRKNINVE